MSFSSSSPLYFSHEAEVLCCVARAAQDRPLCLKAIQGRGLAPVASSVLVSSLPGSMTVLAECFAVPVVVANQYFAAHMNQAWFRHQEIAVAELLPVVG